MKRKIITTILLSIFLGSGIVQPNIIEKVNANEASTSVTPGGELGYTINLARHEVVDHTKIKMDTPIFNESWYQSIEKIKRDINTSEILAHSANSLTGISEYLEADVGTLSAQTLGRNIYIASAANRFSDVENMNYSDYMYQFYSTYNQNISEYSMELKNYKIAKNTFKTQINESYISDLGELFSGDMSEVEFFDKYGTHVIAKAIYGGTFEINYSVVSNRYDVWGKLFDTLAEYVQTDLYAKVGINPIVNFDVFEEFDFSTYRANQSLQIRTVGGNSSSSVSTFDMFNHYNYWTSSVADNPVVISTSNDGLIPLWDLLPSPYSTSIYKTQFISKYTAYVRKMDNDILEQYDPSILNEEYVDTEYELVRPGEITVTDEGMFLQDYDVMDLNEDFDVKYNYMKAHGYTKMYIYLEMLMREIDMGYQIVAFYYSEKEDELYEIERFTNEYQGDSLGTEYEASTTLGRLNIPIETFENEDPEDSFKIVFRYSADGIGSDTWVNRDVYCNITYVK